MACLLAKIHQPQVDVRKPYTKIEATDTFSGRYYDEQFITPFINSHHLPCNDTTAFLTPALRNRNVTLTTDVDLVGRPPRLYQTVLRLLDAVHTSQVAAADVLAETVRHLIVFRDERQQRINSLIAGLETTRDAVPLSSEDIVTLIEQHMRLPKTSRLPVLVVTAAYRAAQDQIGEQALPLYAHNAADVQTGALGDIEITLADSDEVVTTYEMKDKRVTIEDLERAVQKIALSQRRIDNYLFVTTDQIAPEVQEYARSLYQKSGGIEFALLDCIGFLRHFLHLFHRLRAQFLETYQTLMLEEPESAVSQPVKEAFLSMRQAAEADTE